MSTAVEVKIRGIAVRWASDDFPGWIEVTVRDVNGVEHRIIEKVPVLTDSNWRSTTAYPCPLWVAAEMKAIDGDTVHVLLASGVGTVDGSRNLAMNAADVFWL